MNAEQATSYLQALLASVTIGVIIPLVILVLMLSIVGYTLLLAQRRNDFDIAQIFCDETARPTTARFIMLLAFGFSCYYLTSKLLSGNTDPGEFYAFLAAWSSSLAMLKLAEKWDGRMPFSKGPDQGT